MSVSGSQAACEKKDPVQKGRSPLAHLLHALNQPLTGLQCSLELAMASPRTSEQYTHTLRDGLELTARMRVLVEAIRELAEGESPESEVIEILSLDTLLRETVEDLLPVAETKRVQISLSGSVSLPVRAGRQMLPTLIFRFLESALSLTEAGGALCIGTEHQREEGRIVVSWTQVKRLPQYSPFSRPELGLLIASAGWKRMGADYVSDRSENVDKVTVRFPLALLSNSF
jgi:His Kinase A (phospho-acceptor) domain